MPAGSDVKTAALEMIAAGKTQAEAAAALGIKPRTLSDWVRAGIPKPGFEIVRHNVELDAEGNLRKEWVGSKPAAGEEYAIPAGHVVKGESALVNPEGRVLAKWIKTKEGINTADLMGALDAAFRKYDGAAPTIEAPSVTDTDLLTLYPIPDLHFGMYAWGAETGSDYDTSIATRIAEQSIGQLVAQSMPSETAVILVLGDFFHANDQKDVTPGNGHRLDTDGRWGKVYFEGCKLLLSIVNTVARKHKTIILKVLQGNHDEDAAVTMAIAMALFFSADPRVTVDMSPKSAWYYEFGRVLIGAHHGHEIRKPEMMAAAMACDMPQAWGRTEFRHFLSGHIHHASAKEVMGVLVESFNSPAAPDAWNARSGYRSSRAFTALTFHREQGEVGRHRVNIRKPALEAA